MKVTVTDKEILGYRFGVEIENEGERYQASIYYDTHEGYEVMFYDSMGKSIPKPQWAKDLEESEEFYHLGYWLEDQFEGRFTWTEEETANV